LGKTIEAGLIWTELAARHRYKRLAVVCPKILCEKWKLELSSKFDVDARIMGPEDLRSALSDPAQQRRGFAAICGLQSIRPRPRDRRANTPADRLADMIDTEIDAFDTRIDLLVVDEAHHLRNQGTQSNAAGRMLARLAQHTVLLSATPINLKSADLRSLLTLVDPDTFRVETALDEIIAANAPLIRARDLLLRGGDASEVAAGLREAARNALLRDSRMLGSLLKDLSTASGPLAPRHRARLATRIEDVNQLANVVNRTRRRDVEEMRVTREAVVFKACMTPQEAEVYANATAAILDYADAKGFPPGFLTVMPQRMLASCMPAALAHWSRPLDRFDFEDGGDIETDFDQEEMREKPLRQELHRLARQWPAADDMARQDSKFAAFAQALTEHLTSNPGEKVVVFSTFHGTLDYLARRLRNIGIQTEVLDSRVKDRPALLARFRDEPPFRVLLSSEVGSEGIDLQFATAVINYDLPWNPMRVEQRIGRIDRLGQKADKVKILNLIYAGTIDERIWDRLYHRLKLCEQALGGFEEILGTQMARLEKDLLGARLSEAEQEQRIEQTRQAIENVREHEERLESEAASLIAHGDYILSEIRGKRDGRRWISPEDIVDYLHLGLGQLHPRSSVVWNPDRQTLDIRLDTEARHMFSRWGEEKNIEPGPLSHRQDAMTFRLGDPDPSSRIHRMTQAHPLLRYISDRIAGSSALAPGAIAVRTTPDDCGLAPGVYVGAVQEWAFGAIDPDIQLVTALIRLGDAEAADFDTADTALRRGLEKGSPWTRATEELDLDTVADQIAQIESETLSAALERQANDRIMRAQDRLQVQLRVLESGADRDRARILQAISTAGQRMEPANRARLEKLEERIAQRRMELESRADAHHEWRNLAAVLMKVEA
ncbi:MAG: hypothetical protein KDK01_12995, partial [Rhodobacteraceae bacterium]|nr:hypothetical protein [Paracoccaceae bacterium]